MFGIKLNMADLPNLCDLKSSEEKEAYCQKYFETPYSKMIEEFEEDEELMTIYSNIQENIKKHPE